MAFGKVRSGAAWSFLSTSSGAATQLVYLYLIAQYGGAASLGFYALLAAFQSIAYLLQDSGLLTYYIHRQDLTLNEQSALFWIAVCFSVAAASVLAIASPIMAGFYDSSALITPLYWIAAQVLVLGFSSQPQAHLIKELKLSILAKAEIAGKLAGLMSFLGLWQFNSTMILDQVFFSMFIGSVIRAFLITLESPENARLACKTKPDWSIASAASKYIGYHLGAQFLNQFRANLDIFILTKLVGAETTGIYALAKEVILKPSRIIQPVIARIVIPVLASVQGRKNAQKQKDLYLKSLKICAWVNGTVFSAIALVGPYGVSAILNNKYSESAALIPMLCIWGYCRSLGAPSASLAYANGKTSTDFYWNLMILPVHLSVIITGAFLSVEYLAGLLSAFQVGTLFMVYFVFPKRMISGITAYEYCSSLMLPLSIVSVFVALSFAVAK